MDKLKTIIRSSPFIITVIYVLTGFLWITYSDQMVLSMFEDTAAITQVQSIKGWFYVIASGGLIFYLIYQSNDFIESLITDVKKSRDKFESTVEYAPIGIAHHKPNESWILVNKALCKLLGYRKNELLSLNFEDFIHPDDLKKGRELDQNLIDGQISSYKMEKKYRRKDGSYFIGKMTKSVVYDKDQKAQYLIATVEDITGQKENERQLKTSLKEKEVLLSEVHHRVKNNIALLSALLELQLMYSVNRDITDVLEHFKTRLKTLSLIYENFSGNETEPTIEFNWYLDQQVDFLQHTFNEENGLIKYQKEIEEIVLNINQAIPVGLVCNELLSIANHHNFKNVEGPFIKITLQNDSDSVIFITQTNGTTEEDLFNTDNPDSMDFHIINALVKQIDGEVTYSHDEGLQTYKLSFRKGSWKGAASYNHPEAK